MRATLGQVVRSMVVLGLFALALVAGVGAAGHAGATEMDKGAFKQGCEAGGGSYVENASDGSFACNLKSGGTIRCADTKSQCTYTANLKIHHGPIVVVPSGSVLQALAKGSVSKAILKRVPTAPVTALGQQHARHAAR